MLRAWKGYMQGSSLCIAVVKLSGQAAHWQSNSIRHMIVTHHKESIFCLGFWHEHTMLPLGHGVLWQGSPYVQELLPTNKTTVR